MTPHIGSLFSGAGGLDLAVEAVFGGRTIWHCENDVAASKVLAFRSPGVPNLGDIMAVDWSTVEAVDILCGGFPCQDLSAAGGRAGLYRGTRSGLWAHMAEAIDALHPAIVVIENVGGLLSADGEEWPAEVVAAEGDTRRWDRIERLIDSKINRAMRNGWWHGEYRRRKQYEAARVARLRKRAMARFRSARLRLVQRAIGTVVGTLSQIGYDAQWTTVSADSVGAPHHRERVFIVAHPKSQPWRIRHGNGVCAPTNHESDGWHKGWPQPARFVGGSDAAVRSDESVDLLPTPAASRSGNNQSPSPGAAVRPSLDSIRDLLPTPSKADGDGGHLTRSGARPDELLLPGVARAYGLDNLLPTPTSRDQKGPNQRGDESCLHGALLPTPNALDGHPSSPGRYNAEGHQTTLPGTVRLLPTPAARLGDSRGRGASHPDRRKELCSKRGGELDEVATHIIATCWGNYEPAIRHWEGLTRPAPSPTEPNSRGNPRLNAPFAEWMMGWPAGWVTDLDISRNEQLRIIGNGVVPQQAYAALRWLLIVEAVAS
jgi:DNA (cytosine-5)-methyltransferase 1